MSEPLKDRRAVLAGGAALVAAAGAVWMWGGGRTEFAFEWLDQPEGFRTARWDARVTTAAFDPLIGVDGGGGAAAPAPFEGDLCAALFGGPPPAGVVPIASFSDAFCPYCKGLIPELAEIAAEPGAGVAVRWHEWPLFGERSMASARLAMAAERQGAYDAIAPRLIGSSFLVTPAYVEALARDAGVDPARLVEDMHAPAVERRIAESVALTRLFGFMGTPSLVVGRTVVQGAIPRRALEDLIAVERALPPVAACAGRGA